MKDPKRLLDSEAGLAREILHMAASQAVPDSSVAAVLRAVDLALEGKSQHGTDALIREYDSVARAEPIARSRLPRRRRSVRFWTKFGLTLKASILIPAGAALAAALGGSVIVGGLLEAVGSDVPESVESMPPPRQPRALTPSAVAVRVPTSEPLREQASVQPPRARSITPRRLSPARGPLYESATMGTGAFEDDWLGQQFALIARARRNLDAGNSAEALEILADYARRFPEGTLGQQAAALRERAGEASSSEPPPGGRLDLGI